jgi:hypothetical protein
MDVKLILQYALSKNCRMEFQFAVESVRIPVIVAVVGTGYQWEKSEVSGPEITHFHSFAADYCDRNCRFNRN